MDANQAEQAAGIVHGLCSEVERISGKLQQARAWAKAWKRAARRYRETVRIVDESWRNHTQGWYVDRLKHENEQIRADNQRQASEIARLTEKVAWWENEAANTLNLYNGAVDELAEARRENERLREALVQAQTILRLFEPFQLRDDIITRPAMEAADSIMANIAVALEADHDPR